MEVINMDSLIEVDDGDVCTAVEITTATAIIINIINKVPMKWHLIKLLQGHFTQSVAYKLSVWVNQYNISWFFYSKVKQYVQTLAYKLCILGTKCITLRSTVDQCVSCVKYCISIKLVLYYILHKTYYTNWHTSACYTSNITALSEILTEFYTVQTHLQNYLNTHTHIFR